MPDTSLKIGVNDFNLQATLESGQVFGFVRGDDGAYEGRIYGTPVKLCQDRDFLRVDTNGSNSVYATWHKLASSIRQFFDLERDLAPVYDLLNQDRRLRPAYEAFKGLRVIRQDPWEALACFIISSNNNIKRIQGIRRNLSRAFSDSEFGFPSAHALAEANEATLRSHGLGYRAPFLLRAARVLAARPKLLDQVRNADYARAKAHLLEFPGIGDKVAECILLFGFQKYEAFPVDVWIHRAVRKLYFRNRKVSERKILEFGQRRWGTYAGYVQQYLYHGAKTRLL